MKTMLPQTILVLVLLNLFSQAVNLEQEIKTKIIQKHHWYWRRVIAVCILILKQPSRYSSHTVVLDRNNVSRSMWFSFSFAITYKFKHIPKTTLMFLLLTLNSSLCGKSQVFPGVILLDILLPDILEKLLMAYLLQ